MCFNPTRTKLSLSLSLSLSHTHTHTHADTALPLSLFLFASPSLSFLTSLSTVIRNQCVVWACGGVKISATMCGGY